jgi:hypothetical protein
MRTQREVVGAVPRQEALVFAIEDAAEHDHIDLIKELISEGADVTQCTDPLVGQTGPVESDKIGQTH